MKDVEKLAMKACTRKLAISKAISKERRLTLTHQWWWWGIAQGYEPLNGNPKS
jgi:hypothetical protein